MRKQLVFDDIEWVQPTPAQAERCAQAMMELLACCVAPKLHRAVRDMPAAMAEARRVLSEFEPASHNTEREAEIARLETARKQIEHDLARLRTN